MDPSNLATGGQSSRRELLGPRPAPLKVRKDSYKIKKPPVAPPAQQAAPPPPQQQQQIRRPVIIYSLSPKVIHTTPGDFMSVVQRLTGAAATAASSSASINPSHNASVLSPAARLATFEKTAPTTAHMKREQNLSEDLLGVVDGGVSSRLDRSAGFTGLFPGILSPLPSSLPCISPNLFTPSAEQNQINFFNELSPAFHGNKSFLGINSFLPSPNNFLSSGVVPSPAAYWDLFNQYQEP